MSQEIYYQLAGNPRPDADAMISNKHKRVVRMLCNEIKQLVICLDEIGFNITAVVIAVYIVSAKKYIGHDARSA